MQMVIQPTVWTLPSVCLFTVLLTGLTAGTCVNDVPPTGGLQLAFENPVAYNQTLTLDLVQEAPSVTVNPSNSIEWGGRLLLLMVDPDAPLPSVCSGRYFLHWWQPGTLSSDHTRFVADTQAKSVSYTPPNPPPCAGGSHRYQVLLYSYTGADADPPKHRSGFVLDGAVSMLDSPVLMASTQFLVPCRH